MSLFGCGSDQYGQIGLGEVWPFEVLTEVNSGQWLKISASPGGNHTLGIKADGTLWAWGINALGRLGVGDQTNRLYPTQVGSNATWTSISAGATHSVGVRGDGTMWAWGSNTYGQLGRNATYSPGQVGTDTNWLKVSAGYWHTHAIKNDGTLWATGRNNNRQIGNGNSTTQYDFIQIGSSTWANIFAGDQVTLGIKADGTLWAWGNGSLGQLGNGGTSIVSSPVQIGSDTDWAMVSVGGQHVLALKNNGSLWGWGTNYNKELSSVASGVQLTPAEISASNWIKVSAGSGHSLSIKSDKKLWSFGDNANGKLGRATPLVSGSMSADVLGQVGTADWDIVTAGSAYSMAVTYVEPAPTTELRIAAKSPLGPSIVVVLQTPQARASVASMIGAPSLLARIPVCCYAYAPGPLSAPQLLAFHDFTGQIGDTATRYVMDLITPSGTVRVPISSWQATLRTGASSYVQCVIPAAQPWGATINAATSFRIYRRAVTTSGQVIEYLMAEAPADTPQFDRGPTNHTCTLSGYAPGFAGQDVSPGTDRTLTGIRSISSGASYRVRCAVDWLLRPGQRGVVDGVPFVVGWINYYVNTTDAYMEAGT